ncbi:MAG TPA: response regulator [Fimbriimonadaceae bacterium]|jgi:two-component system KDP operon response regulator KdpE
MNKPKLQIVDDELAIRRFLRASLPQSDFELLEAGNGEEGMRMVAKDRPDVLLLDLGLPDMDGLQVTTQLREWTQIPIIVLSARGQETDKVAALDAGADDYLTKPFGISELLARIRVALRHASIGDAAEPVFESGSLRVDLPARQVFVRGEEIKLTPIEYKLLALLVKHAGLVLTHRQLLTDVWGPVYDTETQYLRVYMTQLRHKIEAEPAKPVLLITEPGVGYRLRIELVE